MPPSNGLSGCQDVVPTPEVVHQERCGLQAQIGYIPYIALERLAPAALGDPVIETVDLRIGLELRDQEYGPGEMVSAGNKVIYRSMQIFLNSVKDHASTIPAPVVRSGLRQCLQGTAATWFTHLAESAFVVAAGVVTSLAHG